MRYKISLIRGDGIGPEQSEATLKVLDAVQDVNTLKLDIVEAEAGDVCFKRIGVALPEETIKIIKASDACLKGPVGETAADVVVRLRIMFDLYANIRPVKAYPNVQALKPNLDFVIVRENTEGVYKGLEVNISEDTAVCLRVITRKNSERIARYAFNIAKNRGKKQLVTAVHKANVMKRTCGLFAEACRSVAEDYPNVGFNELYVDAAAMQLVKNPGQFDVIVTTNMFGDILSDEASMLVGGLGMAPGANIGKDFALFEPVHGSAPKYAGKNVANPCSMILSSAMMLEWLGRKHSDDQCIVASKTIERAVSEILQAGILTRDLGGEAKTGEFGSAVAERVMGKNE